MGFSLALVRMRSILLIVTSTQMVLDALAQVTPLDGSAFGAPEVTAMGS